MKNLPAFVIIMLFASIWFTQAYALKAVPIGGSDTADHKSSQGDKSVSEQKPVIRQSPQPALKDNFIDRNGDGINDNIEHGKPPEMKPIRIEPEPKREKPSRDEAHPKAPSKVPNNTTDRDRKHR